MPIYEYACAAGHRFSVFVHRPDAPRAACPTCGREGRRRISAFALSGCATPGPGPEDAPTTWEATGGADPEVILGWQRTLERRRKLEERYPELARPRSPVLAHEGSYERAPLYADEAVGGASDRTGGSPDEPGDGHAYLHRHGHAPPAPIGDREVAGRDP